MSSPLNAIEYLAILTAGVPQNQQLDSLGITRSQSVVDLQWMVTRDEM